MSKAFNDMWLATCTQVNHDNFLFLVVDSQKPSFDHNLCSKYLNGLCEPILDIWVPRAFQWYNELFNPMSFDLAITLWKFESSSGFQLSKWEPTWGCMGSFFHTFLHSREHEMWLSGFTLGPHICKPLLWSQTQR